MPADLIGYAFAATVAAGGVMGYVSRGMFYEIYKIVFVSFEYTITIAFVFTH